MWEEVSYYPYLMFQCQLAIDKNLCYLNECVSIFWDKPYVKRKEVVYEPTMPPILSLRLDWKKSCFNFFNLNIDKYYMSRVKRGAYIFSGVLSKGMVILEEAYMVMFRIQTEEQNSTTSDRKFYNWEIPFNMSWLKHQKTNNKNNILMY